MGGCTSVEKQENPKPVMTTEVNKRPQLQPPALPMSILAPPPRLPPPPPLSMLLPPRPLIPNHILASLPPLKTISERDSFNEWDHASLPSPPPSPLPILVTHSPAVTYDTPPTYSTPSLSPSVSPSITPPTKDVKDVKDIKSDGLRVTFSETVTTIPTVPDNSDDDEDLDMLVGGDVKTGLLISLFKSMVLDEFWTLMEWVPMSPISLIELIMQSQLFPTRSKFIALLADASSEPSNLPTSMQRLSNSDSLHKTMRDNDDIGIVWFESPSSVEALQVAMVAVSPYIVVGTVMIFEHVDITHAEILMDYLKTAQQQHIRFEWVAKYHTQFAIRCCLR